MGVLPAEDEEVEEEVGKGGVNDDDAETVVVAAIGLPFKAYSFTGTDELKKVKRLLSHQNLKKNRHVPKSAFHVPSV